MCAEDFTVLCFRYIDNNILGEKGCNYTLYIHFMN